VAERNHFFPVLCLAAAGYVVHAWLSPRLRAPFFGLLSLGCILFVLGWPDGFLVIGIGGTLIGACHLPLPFAVRVGIVALTGLVLALLRLEVDGAFWPVLGSMFMFRLIVYLFELRHAAESPPLALRVAYFFPLPNVSFLFFPVLDFKTFRETYRADAPWTTAQAGVGWIVRGVVHLIAYRVVKYHVLPDPHQLGDVPHLALFLAASYALYLHVSGYFHIITGVFHLFGFELPRTHHNYFLASSFTDVWRRINIYWKDFMAKVVFVPAFFSLRCRGHRAAAAAATLLVFLATWLFHSYQVFWLTGSIPLSLYDGALWLGLGVLVAVNLQFDLARAARPRPRGPRTLGQAVGLSVRVVGMFVLISLFWASWNTPAVFKSMRAVAVAGPDLLPGLALVLGVLLTAVVVGVVGLRVWDYLVRAGRRAAKRKRAPVAARDRPRTHRYPRRAGPIRNSGGRGTRGPAGGGRSRRTAAGVGHPGRGLPDGPGVLRGDRGRPGPGRGLAGGSRRSVAARVLDHLLRDEPAGGRPAGTGTHPRLDR
jgi:hypothetical protein